MIANLKDLRVYILKEETNIKLSFYTKDNEYQNSNKKMNNKDKLSIKINENINNLFSKVDSLQEKYLLLTQRIDDLFIIIKKINNQIIETQYSKYYVDGCDNDLINKKIKKRNKTLSVKLKQNKNNNYYKKFDYFDSSYKNKLPNDEANIILRKIEPFLIKEFKKNKNY